MDRDTAAELFEIRCRGILAAAFQYADKSPDDRQWEMLRGEREITMRDMGEISFKTCMFFDLSMIERRRPNDQETTP